MSLPVIEITALRKTYTLYRSPFWLAYHAVGLADLWQPQSTQSKTFVALDDVTLKVNRGERIAVLGRNGAGKSTLLKLIAGLCNPTSGRIAVNGRVQILAAGAQTMQSELTGRQNIESSLLYSGLNKADRAKAFDNVVDFVELGEFLDQPFGSYSLGMQARTQFAVATAIQPEILLVDELLGAGDGYFSAKSAARMKALMESGATIIMVSHSPQAILQYCDRAVWLRGGRIAADGTAADVLAAYESDMQAVAQAGGGALASDSTSSQRDAFQLPLELCTSFVDREVTAAEPLERGCIGEPIKDKLRRGLQAMSYPGPGALRIAEVNWSASAMGSGGFRVGESLVVEVSLKATSAFDGFVRIRVFGYSLSGERCISMESSPTRIKAKSEDSFTLTYSACRLILGTAPYVLSVLAEGSATQNGSQWYRHDLWSKCGAIVYEPSNDSDPPRIHLDGTWMYGDNPKAIPARMSSIQ